MCVIVYLHVIRQDTGPRITDFVALGIVVVGAAEDGGSAFADLFPVLVVVACPAEDIGTACDGLCHDRASFSL